MRDIGGVLFDIDGVLVTSWEPIDGAADAVAAIGERGLRRAFLTNTTSKTCADIAERLDTAGIEVNVDEIVTAAKLTSAYLREHHRGARCWVLNSGDIDADIDGVELIDGMGQAPDVIVLGGAGPEFDHRALSRVVEAMLDGVPVIAMHRGMSWQTDDGLRIDTGVYLPGMAELGGAEIVVVGKPEATGFRSAAALMDVEPEQALMIGDDLHSDVLAAQQVGLTGVLVRTGKFRESVLEQSSDAPDHIVDSVADLPGLLDD